MSEPDWTTHIASGAAWKRFGIMLLLAPILGCVGFFVAFTALFQFLSVLANGEASPHLKRCGVDLSQYAGAIIDFLTYNSERRPFPFAARSEGVDPGKDRPSGSTGRKKTTTRKTATRKRATTKKTTARKRSSTKKTTRRSTAKSQPPAADTPRESD